ncbi:MAG: alpha/beta hydrolase [Cyanobacteria bacterium J06639_1]
MFVTRFAATSLGSMAYVTSEDAIEAPRSPLIFFHGFGGGASSYEWSKVYPAFATAHPVFAPDLLGWGRSQHPQRDYTSEDYLVSLEDFIRAVSDVPVTAIASSFTAALIIRLAVLRPELFDSIFLVCPSGFRDFGQAAERRIPAPIINTPGLDRAIYALGATNELAVRSFLERFIFADRDRISPDIVNAYLTSARKPNADYAALSFLRGDLYFDLAQYVPDLSVPTALVWGDLARFTPPEIGQKLANLNRDRVYLYPSIPDAGIFPHLELPAIVTGLLARWLQSLCSMPGRSLEA